MLFDEHTMPVQMLEEYLADELHISTRAIRLMKRDNPRRYERELIGTLMLKGGYRLNNLLYAVESQPDFFNKEKIFHKYRIFENMISEFCGSMGTSDINEDEVVLTPERIRISFLLNLLTSYFKDFEGKGGRICFTHVFDDDEKINPNNGFMAYLDNITMSGDDTFSNDYLHFISTIDTKGRAKSIKNIISSIKKTFPDIEKNIYKEHSNDFDMEIHLLDKINGHKTGKLSYIICRKDDIAISLDYQFDCGLQINSVREAKGFKKRSITECSKQEFNDLIEEEIDFIEQILSKYKIENDAKMRIMFNKIRKLAGKIQKYSDAKDEESELLVFAIKMNLSEYMDNLAALFVDSFYPGLYGSIQKGIDEIDEWFDGGTQSKVREEDLKDFKKVNELLYVKSLQKKSRPFIYNRINELDEKTHIMLDKTMMFGDVVKEAEREIKKDRKGN